MERNNFLKKTKIYMYITAVLQFQGFIGPVIFVFYTRYMGLTTAEYLFVDGLLFFIMAIMEIPSGVIADYFGRKKVLVISKVFIIIGMSLLLIIKSFTGAIIVSIIYGIFGALESGVAESIIYEKYEKYNCINECEYLNARSNSIGFICSIIYAIISGYLVVQNVALPVILDVIISILLFILVLFCIDDDAKSMRKQKVEFPTRQEINNVLPVAMVAALILGCSRTLYSFFQPILIENNISLYLLGYAAAMYSIVSAVSAALYKKVRENLQEKEMFLLLISLQIVSCFGIAYCNSLFVIFFILLNQIQRGIMGPFIYVTVNGYICSDSGHRVTLMSIFYCITTLISALFIGTVSAATNLLGINVSIIIFSIAINGVVILFLLYFLKTKKNGSIICYTETQR